MNAEDEVGIAVLLPDLLDTYSDAGNAEVLAQRLRWRGIAARIVSVPSGATPPAACQLYLLGGGEDTAQEAASGWLERHRTVLAGAADGAVVLAVCAGLQLLGGRIVDATGVARDGLGLLDLTTRAAARRQVGEAVSRSTLPGVGRLTGFHNHRGISRLGPAAWPLARRESGPSNDPSGRDEGAMSLNAARDPEGPGVVATYLHGPVLARNPFLADHLLRRAVGRRLPELDPGLLPDVADLRRRYLGTTDGR